MQHKLSLHHEGLNLPSDIELSSLASDEIFHNWQKLQTLSKCYLYPKKFIKGLNN